MAGEIISLQRAIVKHETCLQELPATGILVCFPEDFVRGYILTQMHINRLTDYSKYWNSSATMANSSLMTSVYMAQFLSDWGLLTPTVQARQPDRAKIVNALNDIKMPRKVLRGIRVYITPFSIPDTNGFYDPGYDSIFLFGGQSFKWPATETTVGHEMGHAFHYRVLTRNDFNEYWELRKVAPLKDQGYDRPTETIAEDFRILYGGSEKTIRRRTMPGRFGDIRDYPDKLEAVKNFLDGRITDFTDNGSTNMVRLNTMGNAVISATHHPWLYGTGDDNIITVDIAGDERYVAVISRYDMPQIQGSRTTLSEIVTYELKKGSNTVSLDRLETGLYRIQVKKITPTMITNLNAVMITVYREK